MTLCRAYNMKILIFQVKRPSPGNGVVHCDITSTGAAHANPVVISRTLIEFTDQISYLKPLHSPADICLFQVSKRKTRKRCEICSTVNFEHISHLFLVFLLLTLSKWMLAGSYLHTGKRQKISWVRFLITFSFKIMFSYVRKKFFFHSI